MVSPIGGAVVPLTVTRPDPTVSGPSSASASEAGSVTVRRSSFGEDPYQLSQFSSKLKGGPRSKSCSRVIAAATGGASCSAATSGASCSAATSGASCSGGIISSEGLFRAGLISTMEFGSC